MVLELILTKGKEVDMPSCKKKVKEMTQVTDAKIQRTHYIM